MRNKLSKWEVFKGKVNWGIAIRPNYMSICSTIFLTCYFEKSRDS